MIKACLHCGLDTRNREEDFCCLGCSSAYKIINKLGFKSYYHLRQIDSKERKLKPEMEDMIDLNAFILDQGNGSYAISLMVQGLHCAACVWLIESILKKQEKVVKARINLSKKSLLLEWKGDKEDGNRLAKMIYEIGYKLLPFDEKIIAAEEKKYDDTIIRSLAVAGFGAGNIMFFSIILWIYGVENLGEKTRDLLHFFSAVIALPVIIYSARPFFKSALKSIKAGFPNMDLAISIAISLASIVSVIESFRKQEYVYFDSAVMLVFFLLIGRYLDMKARKKAFHVASEFSMLAASFGRVEQGDHSKILPVKDIQKDMILMVAAGEKIAADGVVIDGESEVDASLINGEILPKKVATKSQVFAGMINLDASLKIRVTKTADNSLLSEIIRLSDEIENKKNSYVRIADRLAKIYIPAVHLMAFLTFCLWFFHFGSVWESALMKATAVLIITCPCALALAVPIVQTITISNFIKCGILVKSGEALEKLRDIDVVVFDKTGSLTVGKPQLVDVFLLENNQKIVLDPHQREPYLKLAASLAVTSKHPISLAILDRYNGALEDVNSVEKKGFGLEATHHGKSVKLGRQRFCDITNDVTLEMSDDDNHIISFMKYGDEEVLFLFSDQLKEDAVKTVSDLKFLDKKVMLLSGDIEKNVAIVAQKTGIDDYYFAQTPVTKARFLEDLKTKKHHVLMIGDGLNDAPSLVAADVSISFSNGADISQNVADIIIQGQTLRPIISVINSSQKAIHLMKQNLLIALIYNLIALPFAVLGFVVPLVAAFAMSSSSLLVLLNSFRIRKCRF